MKKLLLFAAMAAVALGASAGYKIEKVWENNNIPEIDANTCRQGLGMNGKFYINDRATSTIYIYDETGQIGTLPGSPNMTITRDEAGNIVYSNTAFPGNWKTNPSITVVNPTTGVSKVYTIPEECGAADLGRCDVLGTAKGDMMTDGELYFTTNTNGTTIVKLVIANGEVDAGASYAPDAGSVTTSTTTPIYPYTDLEGNDALLYYTRTTNPVKLLPDGDNYEGTAISLPYRGTMMACQPFIWDNKELFVYTYKGPGYIDYLDGVAVAEAKATEPLVYVPASVSARTNGTLAINWLWAEPDADGVTIYQYYPQDTNTPTGGHITVYRMTKTPDYTVAGNILNNWEINPANNMILGEDGLYTLTLENVEIPANYMIEYKVTSDGTWWPADFNAQYVINEAGYYTLEFTFDPETGNVSLVATKTGDIHYTGDVYILGEVNDNGGWFPNIGVKMTCDAENYVYTATITTAGENDGYSYFSFTKILAENTWENGGWNEIVGYRFGAVTEGGDFLVTDEQLNKELSLEMNGEPHAFKIPAGQWNLTLSVDNMTLVIEKVIPAGKRGDVDNNGFVDINDVTRLIDVVLGKNVEYHAGNSDCDIEGGNGAVDINDVTALINYVLSGTW